MIGDGARQAVAAQVGQSRFDQLRNANWSCANYRSDSAVTRGIKETWTVTAANARAVNVTLALTYTGRQYNSATRTYQRTVRYQSTILCN
jgi:hypothetical protein